MNPIDNTHKQQCLRYAELAFRQQKARGRSDALTPDEAKEMSEIERLLNRSRHQILECVYKNMFSESC